MADKPCKFPFNHKGKQHKECTTDDDEDDQAWCEIDDEDDASNNTALEKANGGKHGKPSKWGYCNDKCPG